MRLTFAALIVIAIPGDGSRAADLATPASNLPLSTWTGFYTGTFIGFGALTDKAQPVCIPDTTFLRCSTTPNVPHTGGNGFIAGGEAGYDLQLQSGLVVGVKGDYQFTAIRGFGDAAGQSTLDDGRTGFSTYHVGDSLDNLGTVRGRVGYAFNRTLFYAAGGLALGQVTLTATRSEGIGQFTNADGTTALREDWRLGYIIGGGLDYAFADHLSAKFEGDYFDLGSRTLTASDTSGRGLSRGATVDTRGYLVRVGLDYRFGNELPFAGLLRSTMDPSEAAPAVPGAWSFVSGLRYFYSTGQHQHLLGNPTVPVQWQSRLTYSDATAHAGESFARLDHNPTGLFLKGFAGSGGVVGGHLNDEDFPPSFPYSNTVSPIKDGDLSYATIDAGYNLFRGRAIRLGAFLGYAYYADTLNAYGCRQTATGSGTTTCVPTIPTSTLVLSEDEAWNALRVGGTLDARWDRVHATLDAAYLPFTDLSAYDHHWLKPESNPRPQTGTGDGFQLEGVLAYDVTPSLSVGAGARYWRFNSSGSTEITFTSYPLQVRSDRYGGFLQAAYRFAD